MELCRTGAVGADDVTGLAPAVMVAIVWRVIGVGLHFIGDGTDIGIETRRCIWAGFAGVPCIGLSAAEELSIDAFGLAIGGVATEVAFFFILSRYAFAAYIIGTSGVVWARHTRAPLADGCALVEAPIVAFAFVFSVLLIVGTGFFGSFFLACLRAGTRHVVGTVDAFSPSAIEVAELNLAILAT